MSLGTSAIFCTDPFEASNLFLTSGVQAFCITTILYPFDEIVDQIAINTDELSRQDSPCVDVGGVGLEGFVVAEDLACGGGGHWSDHQAVSEAVLHDFLFQGLPVEATQVRSIVP